MIVENMRNGRRGKGEGEKNEKKKVIGRPIWMVRSKLIFS